MINGLLLLLLLLASVLYIFYTSMKNDQSDQRLKTTKVILKNLISKQVFNFSHLFTSFCSSGTSHGCDLILINFAIFHIHQILSFNSKFSICVKQKKKTKKEIHL
jgi:hypothetical protein